jgi:hypothetical protein
MRFCPLHNIHYHVSLASVQLSWSRVGRTLVRAPSSRQLPRRALKNIFGTNFWGICGHSFQQRPMSPTIEQTKFDCCGRKIDRWCLQRIVSVVCSTAIFFTVLKMFFYHLRQKARRCSVQNLFKKLLTLSVCTDYCNCGIMRSLTCCWVAQLLIGFSFQNITNCPFNTNKAWV